MKYIGMLVAASLWMGPVARAASERPMLVAMPVRHVFIPAGFDDNDDVQVVLEGAFPDTCYKLAHTEVLKSEDGLSFDIVQWARKFHGICVPSTVPFNSTVSLGRLPSGTYKVESIGVDAKSLAVVHASADSQDEFIYAPVSTATVGRKNSGHYVATLKGNLPNACFSVDKTDVLVQDKVLVVLPTLRFAEGDHCSLDPQPFETQIDLPSDLEAGKYLLHVRSMSGKAVNVIFFADGD